MSVYAIGQLCKEFGVTPRALRFYEAKGLLSPYRDGAKRVFSQRDRARLQLILRGKRFGFSLGEIGALLDLYDADTSQVAQLRATLRVAHDRLATMRAQRDELAVAIEELQNQMKLVGALLDDKTAGDADATDDKGV